MLVHEGFASYKRLRIKVVASIADSLFDENESMVIEREKSGLLKIWPEFV
jgi:hypothetical protein